MRANAPGPWPITTQPLGDEVMSKRRLSRRPSAPSQPGPDPAEAIALRVHQIAATAGVIAERLEDEPLSHALYLIEETLLEVEQRVERLRRMPQ